MFPLENQNVQKLFLFKVCISQVFRVALLFIFTAKAGPDVTF